MFCAKKVTKLPDLTVPSLSLLDSGTRSTQRKWMQAFDTRSSSSYTNTDLMFCWRGVDILSSEARDRFRFTLKLAIRLLLDLVTGVSSPSDWCLHTTDLYIYADGDPEKYLTRHVPGCNKTPGTKCCDSLRIRMFLGLLEPDLLVRGSVADPGCLSRILIFTPPGSKNSNKRRGWKKIVVIFFVATNYLFYWAGFQRMIELFTKKFVTNLPKIWVWDPRSGIRDPEKLFVPIRSLYMVLPSWKKNRSQHNNAKKGQPAAKIFTMFKARDGDKPTSGFKPFQKRHMV